MRALALVLVPASAVAQPVPAPEVLGLVLSAGFAQSQFGVAVSFVAIRPVTGDEDVEEELVTGINLGTDYAVDPRVRLFAQIGLSLEDNADGTSLGIGTRATF